MILDEHRVSKKHLNWVDNARAFAVLAVVICHAVEWNYYGVVMGTKTEDNILLWLFQTCLYVLGRTGVPFFLMISGTLLLSREYSPTEFYRKSLLPLVITSELWVVFYGIFDIVVNGNEFSVVKLIKQMLFIDGTCFNHTWYLPLIIGLYIAAPFVGAAVKKYSLRSIALPLLVIFCIRFVPSSLRSTVDIAFLGGQYGIYFVLGYYIGNDGKNPLRKIKTVILILAALCFFAADIVCQRILYETGRVSTYFVWYGSAFILGMSICLFECFRRFDFGNGFIRAVAKCSFGIYLLHNVFLVAFNRILLNEQWFLNFNEAIKFVIRFVICFVPSFAIVFVFSLIPFRCIKKAIFLLK